MQVRAIRRAEWKQTNDKKENDKTSSVTFLPESPDDWEDGGFFFPFLRLIATFKLLSAM